MKKILYIFAVAAVLMTVAGCKKDHQCKCFTTGERPDGTIIPDDSANVKILFVGGSISCDKIKEMAYEETYYDSHDSAILVHHVDVLKVNCRDYAE